MPRIFYLVLILGGLAATGGVEAMQSDWQPAADPVSLLDRYADKFEGDVATHQAELRNTAIEALQGLEWWLDSLEIAEQSYLRNMLRPAEIRRRLEQVSPDARTLRAIERRFYGMDNALNQPPILALRTALTHYVNYLEVVSVNDLQAEFHWRLSELDRELNRPSGPQTARIARHVGWLVAARQTPRLVAELQQAFSHPAIVVDVNPDLVLPMLANYQKEIARSQYATNRIIGVPVSGMSHVRATVAPAIADDPERLTIRLQINGSIQSPDNESRPAPQRAPIIGNVSVALTSSGNTSIEGYKEIYWDGLRLATRPANVDCQTRSELQDIDINRRYRRPSTRIAKRVDRQIEKRAVEEVRKKTPEANRASADLARRQIAEQLDEEVALLVDQANAEIRQYYEEPLNGLGLLPATSGQVGAHSLRIGFRGLHAGGIGTAAPLPRPAMQGDLELAVHETMGSGLWSAWLSGRTLSDREFRRVSREIRGFVPAELKISGNQPWSVRLDSIEPLSTRFRDGRLQVALQIRALTIDGETWDVPVRVSAAWGVEPQFDMPLFVRTGEIGLEWNKPGSIDPATKTRLREFLTRKFNAFFARRMHLDGLSAPGGGQWGVTSRMKVVSSEIGDGWWRVVFRARDLNVLDNVSTPSGKP